MDGKNPTNERAPQVAFDYIKGNFFRVVHADGVIGHTTPSGGVSLAFYSERVAIPKREVWMVNSDGSLGSLVREKSQSRDALVREVDFDVVMSLPVAEGLISWLKDRVAELRGQSQPIPADEVGAR